MLYKNLFLISLFVLLLSNSFLIFKNKIDIKNLKSEKKVCPVVVVPTPAPQAPTPTSEIFCGGITGAHCADGFVCQLDGDYPDAGGKCVATPAKPVYTCPKSEWVNCMPSVDQPKNYQCETAFLKWAKANCPNFKGAAL